MTQGPDAAHDEMSQEEPPAPYFFRELEDGTMVSVGEPQKSVGDVESCEHTDDANAESRVDDSQ